MELQERQGQLEELARRLREAGAGAGKAVLVSGEAGAGKSVLIEQFAAEAARSARVVWGHCDALETSRVLGPVNEVRAGLPGLPGEPALPREQLFTRLFERLAPPHPPTMVVLEDLHWADEATLDFVRYLGRRIQRTRCLLVLTYRADELDLEHPLRAVLGELTGEHAARLPVPALSLAAVAALSDGTGRDAREVYRVTGGNPFFVREVLASPTGTVPETVRDAVLNRLGHCSAAAREVTELVSLLPGKAEYALTHAILGDAAAAADEAVARGLLRHQDGALAFRHELGRLAVAGALPQARAQGLHRSILEVLARDAADLPQLVHHAARAQDTQAVLTYAPRAAEQAARAGAHRQAAAHLATALRHAAALPAAERARLLQAHATECDLTNQVAAAADSARRAIALWQGLGQGVAEARVRLLLAMQHWKGGQKTPVDEEVAAAIALLESLPPSRDLAMAYSMRSRVAMTSAHTEEALQFGRRALELAGRFADHGVRAHALNNMGAAMIKAGDAAGMALLQQSLAVALEHNLQAHAGRAYANIVNSAVRHHLPQLARRYLPEGLEYCDTHEVQDCLSYMRADAAQFELDLGAWDKAARLAGDLIEHHALAVPQRVPALVVLALVRARRGDPGLEPLLEEAARLAQPTGELQRIGRVAALRAEVAWYRGDLKAVAAEVAVGLEAARGRQGVWLLGELAYWGHRADPSLRVGQELAEPYALMIRGDWRAAAAAWQEAGMPYERALALADGPEEALREALEILEQLGAGPLGAIVRQRLRSLGARAIPRGPRASTRENPAGLTAREVQVLTLLVRGHTNSELAHRLHVSARTVEHHVSAILEKLQVHSRTEAVAAAFGLGILKGHERH